MTSETLTWLLDVAPEHPDFKSIAEKPDLVFINDLFSEATSGQPIPINANLFISSSFAVLGTSGFGKTMTVKAIISKLYRHPKVRMPFSLFDIESEYWPLVTHHPEIKIYGSRTALVPEQARNIARDIVNSKTPVIFDSSETETDQYYSFMHNYISAIRELARAHKQATNNPMPHMLIFDEADLVIPRENRFGTSDMFMGRKLRALLRDTAKRGRKKGVCAIFASQRVTELDPTTLSQVNFRLLHKVTSDNDMKRYLEWLPVSSDDATERIKRMRKGEVLYNADKVQLDTQGKVIIPYYKVVLLSWANVSKSTTLGELKKYMGVGEHEINEMSSSAGSAENREGLREGQAERGEEYHHAV